MDSAMYLPPPAEWTLPPKEVHIWRIPTTRPAAEPAELARYLTAEEQRRVNRYHFESDRHRALVSRGWLRRLVGRYLGVEPLSLEFAVGPQGKLSLADSRFAELSLNVTHSGELVMYAFARRCELGLDVEHVNPMRNMLAIARRHFTPSEIELLERPASSSRTMEQEFFRLWTRKESVIKAVGTGLSTPLDDFDVSSRAGAPGSWFRVEVPEPNVSSWSVCDLPIDAGYCSAMAVEREPVAIRYWTC